MLLVEFFTKALEVLEVVPHLEKLKHWFAGNPPAARLAIADAIRKIRDGYGVLLEHSGTVAGLSVEDPKEIHKTLHYLSRSNDVVVELRQARLSCDAALDAYHKFGLLSPTAAFLDTSKSQLFESHLVQLSLADGAFTAAAEELASAITLAAPEVKSLLAAAHPGLEQIERARQILGPLSRALNDPVARLSAAMGELRALETEFDTIAGRPPRIM